MAQVSPYGRTQRSSLRCWHALILIGLSSWHGLTPHQERGKRGQDSYARCGPLELMSRLPQAWVSLNSSFCVTVVLEGAVRSQKSACPTGSWMSMPRHTRRMTVHATQSKVPLYQECLHVMGDLERCAPGGHMCCGHMGIPEHIRQILQDECCRPSPAGCGPPAESA